MMMSSIMPITASKAVSAADELKHKRKEFFEWQKNKQV